MMLIYCRNAAGLIAVWVVFLGILTIWPDAPDARATGPDFDFAGAADPPGLVHDVNRGMAYVHTGLWVADVHTDGTVVYLRQIKRR